MTDIEAWLLIQSAIGTDCGPSDEGWQSDELLEAVELFHRRYAPHLSAQALFPDNPLMWPRSQRSAHQSESD